VPSELACTTERWLRRWAKICYGFGLDPTLSTTSCGLTRACVKQRHPLCVVLSELSGSLAQRPEFFELVNLGLVQSMASGILTPTEAVERFYHARNCLYV
jgi:hypothetical protein